MNNKVREVLVNELGLTRESVREDAHQFIARVLERYINRLAAEGKIEEMLRQIVEQNFRDAWGRSGKDVVNDYAHRAIQAAAAEIIREKFDINVEEKR